MLMNKRLLCVALCAALAACGSPEPVAYSGIASSSQMTANSQDASQRITYRYSTPVDWRRYSKVIVDPVAIYRGSDNQFGDMSQGDKAALANYMYIQFAKKLRSRFALATDPAPDTLRVKLTLTGAATNTPVLATLSRFDLAGRVYNGVQAVRGCEGMLTGSGTYLTQIYGASTHPPLSAFVTK